MIDAATFRTPSQEEWRHKKHSFLSSGTIGRNRCDLCGSHIDSHRETPYGNMMRDHT